MFRTRSRNNKTRFSSYTEFLRDIRNIPLEGGDKNFLVVRSSAIIGTMYKVRSSSCHKLYHHTTVMIFFYRPPKIFQRTFSKLLFNVLVPRNSIYYNKMKIAKITTHNGKGTYLWVTINTVSSRLFKTNFDCFKLLRNVYWTVWKCSRVSQNVRMALKTILQILI